MGGLAGCMSPRTGSPTFIEDSLCHPIPFAKILYPAAVFTKTQQTGDAGETTLGELSGDNPVHRSPANGMLHHAGVLDIPHHRRIGGMVLRNPKRMLDLMMVQSQDPSSCGRAGHRPPRSAGLVFFVVSMPAAPGSDSDFIPNYQRFQELFAACASLLRNGQCSWDQLGTRMAACEDGIVIDIQTISSARVGKGGSRRLSAISMQ
jgi:hypothetical protein